MRITSYGLATLAQIAGIVLAVTFLPEGGWWSSLLGLVGVFIALDATEMMAVLRARGDNTNFFYRKRH